MSKLSKSKRTKNGMYSRIMDSQGNHSTPVSANYAAARGEYQEYENLFYEALCGRGNPYGEGDGRAITIGSGIESKDCCGTGIIEITSYEIKLQLNYVKILEE